MKRVQIVLRFDAAFKYYNIDVLLGCEENQCSLLSS